jgi:hypothetical protein
MSEKIARLCLRKSWSEKTAKKQHLLRSREIAPSVTSSSLHITVILLERSEA